MDFPTVEPVPCELEDVFMADAENSTDPQTLAPPVAENNSGSPFNVHQLHPPRVSHPPSSCRAIHQTENSATASVTTHTFLPTSVSAPVAHVDASPASYTPNVMRRYADRFQRERTRIRREEAKAIDDEILALSELSPGSLNAAAEARASSFTRTLNRHHNFRPQRRFGRKNGACRARFPSASSMRPVVTSQGSTHNLHGPGGEFGGHEIPVAPSICVSVVAHDRRGEIPSEIQPPSPPTGITPSQTTPLVINVPPSSPIAGQSGLFHTLPVPSPALRTTASQPNSSFVATTQKLNTNSGTTRNVGNGPSLQQVGTTLPLDPSSNAIAQSPRPHKTSSTSNMGSSSVLPPSLITRSPVAPRLPVAPTSTPVLGSSSTTSAILQPRPANRRATQSSSSQQQGSSSVTQSLGTTVPVRTPGPVRPRPKWMDDDEEQEEKETAKREEWKRSHFSWGVLNGNRNR
jgi:hypothetical protein